MKPTSSSSAPKINSNFLFKPTYINSSTLSQGVSPSEYKTENCPLFSNHKIFFDENSTILELHMLGELSPLDPINNLENSQKRKSRSVTRSLSFKKPERVYPTKFPFINISPTVPEVDEDYSLKSPISFSDSTDLPYVQLQAPPLNRYKKRRERCSHENEEVNLKVIEGEVKRYNLKNRFGFIYYKQQKVNVYEDDLILSGTNIKKFKDLVKKKCKIIVEFQLKKVFEEGVEKLRPINIQVII